MSVPPVGVVGVAGADRGGGCGGGVGVDPPTGAPLMAGLYPFAPDRFGRLGVEARLAGRRPLPLPDTDCPDAWQVWQAWVDGYDRADRFLASEQLPPRCLTAEAAAVRATSREQTGG